MFLRFFVLVLLSAILSACAMPLRVTMTPEQRAQVKDLKARVIVVQDEVIAAVQPSQLSVAAGGGLIFAMIDSSITNTRVKESQKIMGPFYALIEDVDYRTEFTDVMKRELANYPIKISDVVTTPRMLNMTELNQLREELSPGQALMVIVPKYSLSMDFRSFDAEAWVTLWVKGEQSSPIQRGVLRYQSQLVGSGGKASIDLWSADDSALFRKILRESIFELKTMVLMDIDVPATPLKEEEMKPFSFNTGMQQVDIQGKPLKQSDARIIVVGKDGKLYSLPKTSSTVVVLQK